MAIQAQQRFRGQRSPAELEATGLLVQTVMYRAPEWLYNEQDYGVQVDSWSLGLMLAEAKGWDHHRVRPRQKKLLISRLLLLFRLPAADAHISRPRMFGPEQEHATIAWSKAIREALGENGADFLDGLLRWEAAHRWTPAMALHAKFFFPEAMALTGRPADMAPSITAMGLPGEREHAGARHHWNMLAGCIDPDVLQWLRAEPALRPGSEAWKELGVTFVGKGTALADTPWAALSGVGASAGWGG